MRSYFACPATRPLASIGLVLIFAKFRVFPLSRSRTLMQSRTSKVSSSCQKVSVERSRTSCQNVETEFMTPAATVLHNKSFLRSSDDLLFDPLRCTLEARYIQYIQLVDSYIYPKLPELYVTKTRGFVFNAARTIDCIETQGCKCNEVITYAQRSETRILIKHCL